MTRHHPSWTLLMLVFVAAPLATTSVVTPAASARSCDDDPFYFDAPMFSAPNIVCANIAGGGDPCPPVDLSSPASVSVSFVYSQTPIGRDPAVFYYAATWTAYQTYTYHPEYNDCSEDTFECKLTVGSDEYHYIRTKVGSAMEGTWHGLPALHGALSCTRTRACVDTYLAGIKLNEAEIKGCT